MNRFLNYLFLPALYLLVSISCSKDDEEDDAKAGEAACRIDSETTSLIGNEATWQYEYDEAGNPTKITEYNRYGGVALVVDIFYDGMRKAAPNSNVSVATVYDGNIFTSKPTKANVSITEGAIEQRNFYTFFFFYDAKGRLETVGEQTDYVSGDFEWDLHITYDDNDNVTQLQYEFTTGPRDPIPPVVASGYDKNPTPYSGVNGWKFLLNNSSWNNYDPAPILVALSQNNPLGYTTGEGANKWTRTMSYTYNEQGFPVECVNTNVSAQGETGFRQTFAYTCK
jgi:YD repeat-containing protein